MNPERTKEVKYPTKCTHSVGGENIKLPGGPDNLLKLIDVLAHALHVVVVHASLHASHAVVELAHLAHSQAKARDGQEGSDLQRKHFSLFHLFFLRILS